MTAVVGILNKSAVAIAADSAVTFSQGNRTKILNRANKIFTLSKYHPVGTMIYSSAEFMDVPWETIIKIYRAQLKEKSFNTLIEYQQDFIEFIRKSQFFTDINNQKRALLKFLSQVNNILTNDVLKIDPTIAIATAPGKEKFQDIAETTADNYIAHFSGTKNFYADFLTYDIKDFLKDFDDIFKESFTQSFENYGVILRPQLADKLKTLYFYCAISKETFSSFTGIIFTGYGEAEIYASLIPIRISFGFSNRLRYEVRLSEGSIISNDNFAAICPFAQDDVINTILTGVHPKLEEGYKNAFVNFINKYEDLIINVSGGPGSALEKQIRGIDKQKLIIDEFDIVNQNIVQQNFIRPLLDAVNGLSKDDLGEMAESLIYLTYLQRRMTNAEESVGGPVDVAIISKGDGFIWLKRKHYFKPELNQQFFNNYYK